MPSILIADDNEPVLHAARFVLIAEGWSVETVGTRAALAKIGDLAAFDVVLLDMNFVLGERSGRDGLWELAQLRGADPNLSVVVMTAYGAIGLAVEALKAGSADVLLKPWRNERLLTAVTDAAIQTAERRRAAARNLDEIERDAIAVALAQHGGNFAKAAVSLGLTRQALYRRIEKHGL